MGTGGLSIFSRTGRIRTLCQVKKFKKWFSSVFGAILGDVWVRGKNIADQKRWKMRLCQVNPSVQQGSGGGRLGGYAGIHQHAIFTMLFAFTPSHCKVTRGRDFGTTLRCTGHALGVQNDFIIVLVVCRKSFRWLKTGQ